MDFTHINVTESDWSWIDPHNLYEDRHWQAVFVGVYSVFLLLFRTPLHVGLILYERIGGDPQKRGISNKLVSHGCQLVVICIWIQVPVRTFRLIIGPIESGVIFWPWMFSLRFYFYFLILNCTEIAFYHYLSIVVLKRMLPLLEDFFAFFITSTNILVAAMMSLVNCFSIKACQQEIQLLGLPKYLHSFSPISPDLYTNLCLSISFGITVYAGVKTMVAKKKQNKADGIGTNGFNNTLHNTDLVNNGALVFLFFINFLTFIAIMLLTFYNNVFEFLVHSSVTMFVVPGLLYVRNPEMRQFVQDLIL